MITSTTITIANVLNGYFLEWRMKMKIHDFDSAIELARAILTFAPMNSITSGDGHTS